MSEIIQIEELRVARKAYSFAQDCKHLRLEYSLEGEIIECRDCNKQIPPFWAFTSLIEQYKKAIAGLQRREQILINSEAKSISLRAAQRVETAWRSKSMVPTCPHCREAIYSSDGFGSSFVNKEIADRRRAEKSK